jgi:creatinine amidohydrolase
MFAVACMWSKLGKPEGLEDPGGIHGGLIETSLMLRLAPERVDMARARNFRSAWLDRSPGFAALAPEGPVGFGWETQDLHPAGALGDASRATAEIGERVLAHAAARVAALLQEVSRFDLDRWLRDAPEEPDGA